MDLAIAFKMFFGAVIAYMFHRLKKMENKAEIMLTRREISELVQSEVRPLEVRQQGLKESMLRIEKKLDLLIEQKLR